MNKKNKLGLIAFAACLAIAVLCLSSPVPAQPARGTGSFDVGANLVNPHPDQDDDASDDTGDPSGDATPVPEPNLPRSSPPKPSPPPSVLSSARGPSQEFKQR